MLCETSDASECRILVWIVSGRKREVCLASTRGVSTSVSSRESSCRGVNERQTPQYGGQGTAVALQANAPCSCGRFCTECRRADSSIERHTRDRHPAETTPERLQDAAEIAAETPTKFRSRRSAPHSRGEV